MPWYKDLKFYVRASKFQIFIEFHMFGASVEVCEIKGYVHV